MPYITVPQNPIYHQMTLDDLLSGKITAGIVRSNTANTRTFYTTNDGHRYFDADHLIVAVNALVSFVAKYKDLYLADRHTLYRTFKIPKRSGGLRTINAPEPPLMEALNELRNILEIQCGALYHTSAFAYIKERSTVDAVRKHQQNNSRWFLKVDFHDFFGSTTKEFTMHTLAQISPFNLILNYDNGEVRGREVLSRALDLCFLDGGLPQGTPISPMLTNLLMIPVDHNLSNLLREYDGQQFVYTRYADDILISSFTDFDKDAIQSLIRDVLTECDAPYTFKEEKTRYGSRAGSNWNLGVMLNKDNNITVGHRNKKHFRAMLNSYILDRANGKPWELGDIQSMNGLLSYYRMIEKEYFDHLLTVVGEKHGIDVKQTIRTDLGI